MKRNLILFFLMSALCSLFFFSQSCQKASSDLMSPDYLIASAKEWYTTRATKNKLASGKLAKVLDLVWEEAVIQEGSDKNSLVIVPVEKIALTNKNLDFARVILFTITDAKVEDGLILEFYGSSEFLATKTPELVAGYRKDYISNFTGSIILYDADYNYLTGIIFENGKRQNTKTMLGGQIDFGRKAPARISGRLTPTNKLMNAEPGGDTCVDWYLVQRTYSGELISATYAFTVCTPPIGGGGGGTGPGPGSATVNASDPLDLYQTTSYSLKINLAQKFNCFNQVASAGATYTVSLNADLPVDDNPGALLNRYLEPGHSFITMTKANNGSSVTMSYGFYPENGLKSTMGNRVASQISNNNLHEYDASITMTVTEQQFENMKVAALYRATEKYELDDYNCTDYALDVFNQARSTPLFVPDSQRTFGNYGTTPNGLFETIKSLHNSGATNTNVGATAAPIGTQCP